MNNLLKYISQYIASAYRYKDLLLAFNPEYINKKFKYYFGISVYEYLDDVYPYADKECELISRKGIINNKL